MSGLPRLDRCDRSAPCNPRQKLIESCYNHPGPNKLREWYLAFIKRNHPGWWAFDGVIMRIECDIEGIDPTPELFRFFDRVLRHAAGRVSLDLTTIDRVVIVSPERFDAAVDSIRPGATHTNTETMVAAGKTFPRCDGDQVVSDIVFQVCLFESLAPVLADPPTSSDWGVDQQQALYIVTHEFGHAIDHALRNDALEVANPRARPFSIRETADYYGSIVPTEYAACRNSASVMTDSLFSHEMQEATNRMTACGRQVNHYLDNPDELTPSAMAHFVCQGAWFYMVELTKLYGYASGVPDCEAAVRELETELIDGPPLGGFLDCIGATYPNWDVSSQIEELIAIWHRYTALSGVQFVARDHGPDEMVDVS
ncbi:MAG: hypothetical protein ACYC0X_15410 [Pirellulaceae bacterium]